MTVAAPATGGNALVVLISGRGSNLLAIIEAVRDGRIPGNISAVISNRPDAEGLAHARAAGLTTQVIDHRGFASRDEFDAALQTAIDIHRPALVVLAGFMRLLGKPFIEHYAGRLLNIHPSLLPALPGLDTHTRALAAGMREHGASVHFVTPEMDAGPIIIQAHVPVMDGDTPQSLSARVLTEEHRIYPQAIRWFLQGRLQIRDGKVLLDGKVSSAQGLDRNGPTNPGHRNQE